MPLKIGVYGIKILDYRVVFSLPIKLIFIILRYFFRKMLNLFFESFKNVLKIM